jgi:2-polyprenyl-3-methyl-5-hydroxy-6-metoxy-1,4-benzoquinol methylase
VAVRASRGPRHCGEPFEASIARAHGRLHEKDVSVEFHHAAFEDFAADSDRDVFDVVLLSWALC